MKDLESDLTISLAWKPSPSRLRLGAGTVSRLDIDAFTDCFVLTCRAKNYRYTDASAAWRLWIRDPKKPLPSLELTEPTNLFGDSDHAPSRNAHRLDRNDSNGIRFSDAGQRKIFRDDGKARRKTFSGGSGSTQPISVPLTQAARPLAWAKSWRDEAFIHLPDIPEDIKSSLPLAIDLVQRDLDPGDPEEVLAALAELATRRGFTLPDGPGLTMDVELLAALPADLFAHTLTRIWQGFSYRRMPEVADFMAHIAVELAERQARLDRLRAFELKLKTIRLRKRWDEEASERAASSADRRARERTEMQIAVERMDREKVEPKMSGRFGVVVSRE